MGHLGCGISAEVADTEGALVCSRGEDGRTGRSVRFWCCLPEVPVLAEETICRTALVEDRQVVAAGVPAALTGPRGNAVGRKRIAVPGEQALGWRSREVSDAAVLDGAQAAETALPLADHALVAAQAAPDATVRARRLRGEAEFPAGLGVDRRDPPSNCGEIGLYAAAADAERCGSDGCTAVTVEAD